MRKRNEYLATWQDGRTLLFVSDNRRTAGEAARSLKAGPVVSIRKVREVLQPELEEYDVR